jgi:hypothetical protein
VIGSLLDREVDLVGNSPQTDSERRVAIAICLTQQNHRSTRSACLIRGQDGWSPLLWVRLLAAPSDPSRRDTAARAQVCAARRLTRIMVIKATFIIGVRRIPYASGPVARGSRGVRHRKFGVAHSNQNDACCPSMESVNAVAALVTGENCDVQDDTRRPRFQIASRDIPGRVVRQRRGGVCKRSIDQIKVAFQPYGCAF